MAGRIGIRRLGAADAAIWQAVNHVYALAFEHEEAPAATLSGLAAILDSPSLWAFAVMDGDAVVGGLTAHVLPNLYTGGQMAMIYDIAILPQYQRQGLGMRLMQALQAHALASGVRDIWVPADEEDVHALDFYRKAGGRPSKVVHFDWELDGEAMPLP